MDEKIKILEGDEGRKLKTDEAHGGESTGGQNPYWPGEGLRKPAEKIGGESEGTIPVVV